MQNSYFSFTVIVLVGLGGCAPEPYLRREGAVTASVTIARPVFDALGVRLATTGPACHVQVVEYWCPDTNPNCQPNPVVTKDESAACVRDIAPDKFSLRTPWGKQYTGTFASGVLDVKIDWTSATIDELDLATLRTGWWIHSDDGSVNVNSRLTLTNDELRLLFAAIDKVTGVDYNEAPRGKRAALAVAISNEPSAGNGNHVVVSVTNRGPDPAYRVVARLNSGAQALQGIRLSFGRIDSGETKKRIQGIVLPPDVNESDVTLDVEVTSSNAARIMVSSRIQLKSNRIRTTQPTIAQVQPAQLKLSCSADKEADPGKQLHIECVATNPGDVWLRGVTYRLAINNAAESSTGPSEIPPKQPVKFDLGPTLPADEKPGRIQITVTANAPNVLPALQAISVEVNERIEPPKLCQPGELTIQDYRKRRKMLDDQRTAGNITREEFNDYLAEWWSCVRQH